MNFKNKKTAIALALLSITSTASHAALHDRGNGLIYDDVLDITWLQDANYALTSGFDSIDTEADGKLRWNYAKQFVDELDYAGFSDWRLPKMTFADANNNGYPDCVVDKISTCTEEELNLMSELDYMYTVNLGNPKKPSSQIYWTNIKYKFIDGTTGVEKEIKNIRTPLYTHFWHGTEFTGDGIQHAAWAYQMQNSASVVSWKANFSVPWPVRDGDVLPNYDGMIEGGTNHAMILKENGELWGWGSNYLSQLGDGTTRDKSRPTLISKNNDYKAISVSHEQTFALNKDGTLVGWGYNRYGKLGAKAGINKTPVTINITDVAKVEAGYRHVMALTNDGSVYTWGLNSSGQLGDGSSTDSSTPLKIANLSDVTFIDSGSMSSYAVKSDGTVWSWGRNDFFQLGRGQSDEHIATAIPSLTNIKMVAAGSSHALALKKDGTVWGWGHNSSHKTGHFDRKSPTATPYQIPTLSNVKSIAAGYNYSLALKHDGTVWGWGSNSWGQLGLGYDSIFESVPVQIANINNAVSIETHWGTTLVLLDNGELVSFGLNNNYQVNTNKSRNVNSPKVVLTNVTN